MLCYVMHYLRAVLKLTQKTQLFRDTVMVFSILQYGSLFPDKRLCFLS